VRTITPTERARLGAHANYYIRVEVQDGSSTWRDLTAEGGVNYVDSATWTASIDQPTMTGTVSFKREAGGLSLAPFVATSALNTIGGSYAPLLDIGRKVRISTAVTDTGVAPVSGDWKEVFLGVITDIDVASDPMVCSVADLGAVLLAMQIETAKTYGDAGGTPVESVMQQILDDAAGVSTYTLVTPVSPTWNILPYEQAVGSVLDALRTLALQIGWDVRYRYDASNVFQLTFFSPDRAKTTVDDTVGPSEYVNVQRLSISDADIRNVVKVNYQDKTSLVIGSQEASDSGSIAEFGRRYMEIGEGSSSNIDTAAEALAMAVAAVSDLSQPLADQTIEQFYFWHIDVGDLLGYTANGVHYTDDQQFGVISYTHTFALNTHRTSIAVRGHVAGAYRQWLLTRNGLFSGQISTGPAPIIFPLQAEGGPAFEDPAREGMAWQQVAFEKLCATIDIYGLESASSSVPIPELALNRLCYSLKRQEGDLWSADNQRFIVGIATRTGMWRKTISLGIGYDGQRGPTVVWTKQAVDVGTPPAGPPTSFSVSGSGTTRRITWVSGDADAATILFRNGYGIVLDPGVEAVIDSNINASIEYHYQLCHLRNGQTSAFAGSGIVTPPVTSSPTAPQWLSGYPQSLSSNGAEYRWTADPSTTRIVIEVSTFAISGAFVPLETFDAPDANVPNGTLIDTSYPPGTRVQARVRATVAGVDYFSDTAPVQYGTAIVLAPSTWYGGTPWNSAGSVLFAWRTASTVATQMRIILLPEPAAGLFPALPTALLYTTSVSADIASGSVSLPDSVTISGTTYSLANRRVVMQTFYATGAASSAVAGVNVAP
jgi:hypothetical protein